MTGPVASNLTACDKGVPLLGVTREFDFGQFIELFDSSPDPRFPDIPSISRIVIQPSSSLAADRGATTGQTQSTSSAMTGTSTPTPRIRNASAGSTILSPNGYGQNTAGGESEVHLFDLTEQGPGAKREPAQIEIDDPGKFFEEGKIRLEGKTYSVPLTASMRDAMTMGLPVTTFATPTSGSGSLPVRLALPFEQIRLTEGALSQVLAGKSVNSELGDLKPVLSAGAVRTLLAGEPVLTHAIDSEGKKSPIELIPRSQKYEPMSDRFEVFDLPSFLMQPGVLAQNGAPLPLDMSPENVGQLINTGRTTVDVGGHTVDLTVQNRDPVEPDGFGTILDKLHNFGLPSGKPPGRSWDDILAMAKKLERNPYVLDPRHPDGNLHGGYQPPKVGTVTAEGGTGTQSSMTDKVQPRLPTGSGLPVAVFVPWKQTWTLKGFSRGNLLHSVALAPLEQVTMQLFSWERRSRSLEQSSETDTEQQTDITQTTRDTEDVFREMVAKRDFAWQLSGSIDASYSPGVASIRVSASGSVSDTNSIQQTARNSSQHVKEATIKASSRVRSRRVTRITQTVESGREDRVTRVIRNPNQCRTLTMDFFETMAHYEIKLEFMKQRLRLVVLVPNPINYTNFVSEIVRRNETTLRQSLIEDALVDGFEACRMVAAYEEARGLLAQQQSEAAKVEELKAQRDQQTPTTAPDPAAPQQAEVERIVKEMIAALVKIRTDAEIDTALTAIGKKSPVPESARRSGQQWLFINFCAAKLPALLSTLDDLSGGTTPPMDAALKILAVLPKPEAPTNLGNLNEMSYKDKEITCISSKLHEEDANHQRKYMKMDWDWGWWSGRMLEENLYTSDDAGLSGLADQLQKAYQAWEAKKVQGDAMKSQDVAKTEAEGKQDKATTDDKLAMAFPLEDLARAYERMKILLSHINEHREFYNYALFQALPPSEQALKIVEASNGKLQVGLFEPRVVAMSGSRLVVPLTPLAGSQTLQDFVTALGNDLETAFGTTLTTPDTTVLPTPGVFVSTRLGECSGCEEYIEKARGYELARLQAVAEQEEREAERRQKRIDNKNYEEFRRVTTPLEVEVTTNGHNGDNG